MNAVNALVLFEAWANDVLHGAPPVLWACGKGFKQVELGPGLVMLLGGAPGAGKTALGMQWVVDALRLDKTLRVLVANVEMTPQALLNRQLSRLSGVDAGWIRHRTLSGQESRIQAGLETLRAVAARLTFHTGPATLHAVAKSVDACGADLIVLDYLQRFTVGDGKAQDGRTELDSVMDHLRKFATAGKGVLAMSAVARQKGKGGSNYEGLGLASFRGSSECEYGADSAWIVSRGEGDNVDLPCHKNRNGDTPLLNLCFIRSRQTFTIVPGGAKQYEVRCASESSHDTFDLGGEGYAEDDVPFD